MTWQAASPRLVLASASPTRRALLESAGIAAEHRDAGIDEAALKQAGRARGDGAEATALALAHAKAAAVSQGAPDALVIGCDQLLVCDERWFDKPATVAQAREHLVALRGRAHVLMTAVLCRTGDRCLWHHVARPRLRMRDFSDAFLDAYLARQGEMVTTTVGAYRLEGDGVHLFEDVEGEHAAILGLPLLPLLEFLRRRRVLIE